MDKLKNYIKGKYKIQFRDNRVEFMDLAPAEIRFLQNNMYQLNVKEWEHIDV